MAITIELASPCSAKWAEMSGDQRVRFCAQCRKNVYNLSTMTAEELAELIAATGGTFCGRFYRRRDGTLLTADCPVGEGMVRRAMRVALVSAVALIVVPLLIFSRSAVSWRSIQSRAREIDFVRTMLYGLEPEPAEYFESAALPVVVVPDDRRTVLHAGGLVTNSAAARGREHVLMLGSVALGTDEGSVFKEPKKKKKR